MQNLLWSLTNQLLEDKMNHHLGYQKYEARGQGSGNNRNGSSNKKLRSEYAKMEINIPRDRNGEVDPILVQKYQKKYGMTVTLLLSNPEKEMG